MQRGWGSKAGRIVGGGVDSAIRHGGKEYEILLTSVSGIWSGQSLSDSQPTELDAGDDDNDEKSIEIAEKLQGNQLPPVGTTIFWLAPRRARRLNLAFVCAVSQHPFG